MPRLAGDGKPVERADAEGVVAFVDEQSSVIGIVAAHLNVVLVVIPHQQDIGQAVAVRINDYSIPVGVKLGFPGKRPGAEVAIPTD